MALPLIQLREKTKPARSFFDDATSALRLARAAGASVIIINDRVDIALALWEHTGVHLGQTDIAGACGATTARRRKRSSGTRRITSIKSEQALDLPIDYLAFGPVFPTRSKQNPDPVAGLQST